VLTVFFISLFLHGLKGLLLRHKIPKPDLPEMFANDVHNLSRSAIFIRFNVVTLPQKEKVAISLGTLVKSAVNIY